MRGELGKSLSLVKKGGDGSVAGSSEKGAPEAERRKCGEEEDVYQLDTSQELGEHARAVTGSFRVACTWGNIDG